MTKELWNEKDCLIIWKSPRTEIEYLSKLLDRAPSALKMVFQVKEETISGKTTKFYRPEVSNPERYFIKFKERSLSYL